MMAVWFLWWEVEVLGSRILYTVVLTKCAFLYFRKHFGFCKRSFKNTIIIFIFRGGPNFSKLLGKVFRLISTRASL